MPKNLKYSELLDCYGTMLTEKQLEVLSLYYNEDYSLSEISDIAGISRQGVMDSIRLGEAQLDLCEQRLNLTKVYKNLVEACSLLEKLKETTDDNTKRKIDDILKILSLEDE